VSFGKGYTCQIEEISTVRIKLFDGMVKVEGCEICSSVKKNLISVGSLEVQGLRGTLEGDILKMFSVSLTVLKGI